MQNEIYLDDINEETPLEEMTDDSYEEYKMQYVTLDSNGYAEVISTTSSDGATLMEIPDDFDWEYFTSYKIVDGAFAQDAAKRAEIIAEREQGAEQSQRNAQSEELQKNLLLVAATANMTDEEIYRYEEAHPVWTVGQMYLNGQVVYYSGDGNIYRCQQNVDARAEFPPGATGTESLYAVVQRPANEGDVLPWIYGEEVHPGDRRMFEGKVYERISPWSAGTNIWEPPTAPSVWQEIVE